MMKQKDLYDAVVVFIEHEQHLVGIWTFWTVGTTFVATEMFLAYSLNHLFA